MGVDLAVVVVTHDSAHVIGRLLDSLPRALEGLIADVVIVDSGSADNTVGVVQARTDCRVIRSANVGYAAGINRGIREAEPADAILVLNPDVELWAGAIRPLLDALRLADTGIAAPQIRSVDGSLYHSLRREPTLPRALGLTRTNLPWLSECVSKDASYDRPQVVDWALGAVLLISRTCYDKVGGWDESYFLYSEETQFSLDARKLGYLTRYVPSSVAMHIGAQSGSSNLTYSMMVINRVRFYRRRHRSVASWCYFGLAILSELSRVARGQRRSWFAVTTLLRPGRRPPQLGCSTRLMPR
jgi:N-acetylglucosaminyl-diphospho-decaprenol L-rhamnosyltransferase